MRKPTICICENKGADQLRSTTAKLISAFVFTTGIVQYLYFLNPKFPVSSHRLCLYSLVCVGSVRKPHCWFSHETAQFRPPKHHLYLVKLVFIGLYLFFLFLIQNIDCGYSLELLRRGGSSMYPQSMF